MGIYEGKGLKYSDSEIHTGGLVYQPGGDRCEYYTSNVRPTYSP